MRYNHTSFNRNRFANNRSRSIKAVPKAMLLAAIAKSKNVQNDMPVSSEVPVSDQTFDDFTFHPVLRENIRTKGFSTLTPIQKEVIPAVLGARDVIGVSNTGTGKTAAFLIPLIQKISQDRAQRVLVVAPTRELAFQIHTELRDFSRGLSIRSALLIGGANEWRQKNDMRLDPHVVIATPGRLKEFIETRVIRLSGFRNVVLDEADRMVDIGFVKEIQYFISLLPRARQSLFFSATISGKAAELLANFVQNPIRVSLKSETTESQITQDVIRIAGNTTKIDTLHALLKKSEFSKVLVFGRTKHGVQKISDELVKRGIKSGAIHGNKKQNQRHYVLNQFIHNEIQILLATDVASRGLDIPNVSHVINYDLPESMDDYIHRIGRTGRATKRGVALTFID
jgi:ATP-dependent RNA helicase RhlE